MAAQLRGIRSYAQKNRFTFARGDDSENSHHSSPNPGSDTCKLVLAQLVVSTAPRLPSTYTTRSTQSPRPRARSANSRFRRG